MGVPDKHERLRKRFQIEPEFASHVDALYSARNSLSHGLGTVRVEDAASDGTLLLRWLALEMHAHGEATNSVIPLGKLFGKVLPEPMSIRIGTVKRELSYKVGDKIALTAQDLYEICLFMSVHVIPKTMAASKIRAWKMLQQMARPPPLNFLPLPNSVDLILTQHNDAEAIPSYAEVQ